MAELSLRGDPRPADLWFWNDWISSLDLRVCSLAAKGLWVEMLGIMFKAKRKGTLAINDKNVDSKDLAKMTSTPVEEIERLIAELESRNVFSRLEDGTIFNRRMYREAEIRLLRAKVGKIGAKRRWQKDGKSSTPPEDEIEDNKNKNFEGIPKVWNDFAKKWNLPPIQDIELGSTREAHLRARMKKKGFSLEGLFQKIEKQPFLLGKNKDAWTITFDWILCPSNYTKIMEEQYPDRIARDEVSRDRRVGATRRPVSPEEKQAQEKVREEFQAKDKP